MFRFPMPMSPHDKEARQRVLAAALADAVRRRAEELTEAARRSARRRGAVRPPVVGDPAE
jgi:hypothetical protein